MPILKRKKTDDAVDTSVAAETPAPKKAVAKKSVKKADAKGARPAWAMETIGSPVFTEKTANLSANDVYVFRVASGANRITVKQAFKALYGVMPVKVNVQISHGKEKRYGRTQYRRADLKRALITVPKGVKIDVV